MADFAAVLKRTLEKMGDTSPEIRAKVYDKARDTVRRQIDAMEKKPSQEAIDRQFAKLEDAISTVEADHAPLTADDELSALVSDVQLPEAVVEPEPVVETQAEPEPGVEPEPAPQEAAPEVVETEPQVVEEVAPQVETSPRIDELRARAKINMARMEAEAASAVEAATADVPSPTIDDAEASLDTAINELKSASTNTADDVLGSVMPERAPSDVDIINDPLGDIGLGSGAAASAAAAPKSGGGFGGVLKLLVLLGILGGGAYYGSQNQDQIKSWWGDTLVPWWQNITGDGDQDAAVTIDENGVPVRTVTTTPVENNAEEPTAPEAPQTNQVEDINGAEPQTKFTQRLTEDGTEVDEGPAEPATTPSVAGEGSTVAEQSAGAETDEAPIEPETEGADIEPETDTAEATPPVAVTPVGQRSIFYEERTGTQEGTAISGATIWSVVNEEPGGGLPVEPAVRAQTNIPELGLEMEMTIRRNGDQTFPASHVIELFFRVPDTFEGRGIADVQRITFKASEQDPGNALIAVPAPLDENIFLIALTDAATAVDTNINLMRRENWVDIPLQYISGRRALVTFEKGVSGERVFEEVFSAWDAAPLN